MHAGSLDHLTHSHTFLGEQHEEHERRTWLVVGLTFSIMVAEIAGGTLQPHSTSCIFARSVARVKCRISHYMYNCM
jgi:Co/Zn/Cd efflux system component